MPDFKIGSILENSLRQFTKVISYRRGIYGLSGWSSRANAEKATKAVKHVNKYGLEYAGAKVVSAKGSSKSTADKAPAKEEDKPTKSQLNKLSVDEVRAKAKELKLDAEGTKPEVLARLFEHYAL